MQEWKIFAIRLILCIQTQMDQLKTIIHLLHCSRLHAARGTHLDSGSAGGMSEKAGVQQ